MQIIMIDSQVRIIRKRSRKICQFEIMIHLKSEFFFFFFFKKKFKF